jgi:hypothetical protein
MSHVIIILLILLIFLFRIFSNTGRLLEGAAWLKDVAVLLIDRTANNEQLLKQKQQQPENSQLLLKDYRLLDRILLLA